ncbi:MAG: Asp-tRNA(Asn)/Glu-tRNA(Gln) amidotransferase subunit GatA [Patescibacteria group bacterium]
MDIFTHTVISLKGAMQAGELTPAEVLAEYKKHIEATDDTVKSFISHDWEAADKRVKELEVVKDKKSLPLYGVPIAIKDVLMIHGGKTTGGSKILENYSASFTATSVQRLLDAGAVVIGKTNCDEFAMGASTENSGFFVTKNPYDTDKVPGGSSGGSASSVAAYQAPAALGSDTGGSIRQPAAFCGVVGLKPTYGRVSRNGLMAMASSLDSVGPLTHTVDDAALLLSIIAGQDELDGTSSPLDVDDYAAALSEDVKGMRVGVPSEAEIEKLDDAVQEEFAKAKQWLMDAGVEVSEVSVPHLRDALAVYYIIMPAEVSSNMARYDGIRYGSHAEKTDDLLGHYMKTRGEFLGDEVKRRIMVGTYVLSSGYVDAYYVTAQKVRRIIQEDITRALEGVDALFFPTTPTTAFGIGEKADDPVQMYLSDIYTVSANIAGVPGISVPSGMIGSLPFGVQFIGKHFDEKTILRLAKQIEVARGPMPRPSL